LDAQLNLVNVEVYEVEPALKTIDRAGPIPQSDSYAEIPVRRQRTALITDDSPMLREMYRAVLEGEGFSVFEATNGAEALLWLQEQHADILLLDLEMPVMDGRSFLEFRRHHETLRQVPVLLISGRLDDFILWHALSGLHVDQMLQKPVRSQELRGALRMFLAQPPIPDLPFLPEFRHNPGRRDARVSLPMLARFRTQSCGDVPGSLPDLSAAGLGAFLPRVFDRGEPIAIRLDMGASSLILAGIVQWVGAEHGALGYRHGIRFIERQADAFPLTAYSCYRVHPEKPAAPPATRDLPRKRPTPRAA
jgi:CheY-like chemotaxis protein